jgi:hypothetical protein
MHFYFSHSYRDQEINSYFLDHLIEENMLLCADQKSDTWCVAKLERYLFEAGGFISVVTRRPNDADPCAYSPYIAHELDLARRARVPRLLFVERQVLETHETRFPADVLGFDGGDPGKDADQHRAAIRRLLDVAGRTAGPPLHSLRRKTEVTLITDEMLVLQHVGNEIVELLSRSDFSVKRLSVGERSFAMDNVGLLETMWHSELCVFLLGSRMSQAHLAMAMAHAHCIPSIRLQYDETATDSSPTLHGLILWQSEQTAVMEFRKQLISFRKGFVEPIAMARSSSVTQVVQQLGTTVWAPEKNHLWLMSDGPGLIHHVATADSVVQDEVERARKILRASAHGERGRQQEFLLCRALYDEFKRHRYAYEIEAQEGTRPGLQKVRSPALVCQSNAATCIDMACLFAAMLEAAGLNPIILILRTVGGAHALVGYRSGAEPHWPDHNLGTLRRALAGDDALFFESTGEIEADSPVVEEEGNARQEKLLDFLTALSVARKLLQRTDLQLLHLIDVRLERARINK